MRLKGLAILLAVCSASCQTAPKVTWRIVDTTGFADKKGVVIPFDSPEANQEACISPDDTFRLLKGCKQGSEVTDLVICGFTSEGMAFGCSDGEIRSISDVQKWACLTARDWDKLLTWCEKHGSGLQVEPQRATILQTE